MSVQRVAAIVFAVVAAGVAFMLLATSLLVALSKRPTANQERHKTTVRSKTPQISMICGVIVRVYALPLKRRPSPGYGCKPMTSNSISPAFNQWQLRERFPGCLRAGCFQDDHRF